MIDDTDEFEVPEVPPSVPSYERVEPRYFGVTPHLLVAALAAVSLLAGLALVVSGPLAVGVLLLVAGVLLALLFAEQARRRRASSIDRAAAEAVDRALALAGFTRAAVGAWTSAGRRSTQLRLEARKLVRERSHTQYELGGAVHAGDTSRVEELRERMRSLDAEIESKGREARAAIASAHRSTRAEQQAVATTQVRRPWTS